MEESLKQQIAQPLGQIVSGCFVLTAAHGGKSTGILASWVQQAGFEPPAVTVAVKKNRPIRDLIEKSGHFVLNTIGEDSAAVFKRFAKGFDTDDAAFDGLTTRTAPTGVIIDDCLAHLGCRVTGQIDVGDHVVYLGQIIAGSQHREAKPRVHCRNNGLSY